MVHDLSPILFRIYGDIAVHWYGLSYVLGFFCAYILIRWISIRQKQGLTPKLVGDFVLFSAIGVLIGGRLGYCLFYSPDLFLKFRPEFPFWGVFALSEGGMSSHGGMIGLVIVCTLFAISHGISRLYLYDLAALVGPVGIFFGRVANYINGELLGRPSPPDFPFGVKFPTEILYWPEQDPVRLGQLATVIEKVPGWSAEMWTTATQQFQTDSGSRETLFRGLEQILEAIQSGNVAVKNAIAPLLVERYPSQLFAAVGEGLLLFAILFILWRRPRKPGVISSCFLVFYSIVRIVDEHFRLPDAHLGFQLLELSRGQWLSIGMLFIGLALLFMWGRREALPVMGWGRGQNVKIHRR